MSPLYPARKPVKAVSDTRKSRQAFCAEQRTALKVRCGGRCEGCGVSLHEVGGDADHVWGRAGTGAGLGFPFADHVSALAALCRSCHDDKTDERDRGLTERLRRESLRRMAVFYGAIVYVDAVGVLTKRINESAPEDLPGVAREIVRFAEDNGWRDRLLGVLAHTGDRP